MEFVPLKPIAPLIALPLALMDNVSVPPFKSMPFGIVSGVPVKLNVAVAPLLTVNGTSVLAPNALFDPRYKVP